MTDRGWLLRRFPVTTVLGLQYAAFAIFPALLHHDATSLLLSIVGFGLLAAFAVEALLAPLRRRGDDEGLTPPRWNPSRAVAVLVVGVASQVAIALLSPSSYAVQLGSVSRSPVASLLTPFSYWTVAGSVLVLLAWRAGQMPLRRALWLLGATSGVLLVVGIRQGILGGFRDYAVTMALMVLLTGIVRLRTVVLFGIGVALIVPFLLHIRNQVRLSHGANQFAVTASESQSRLREDTLINQLQGLKLPLDLGQPSIRTTFRYGLIPSQFDKSRPPLHTGVLVDNALTGGNTSSTSFTVLGNAYAFEGFSGEVAYAAIVALLAGLLLWRRTPFRLVIFALAVNTLLTIEQSYPDGIAGFLQALVAMIPVFVICRVTLSLPAREPASRAWLDQYQRTVQRATR